jgi:hypothetical protein
MLRPAATQAVESTGGLRLSTEQVVAGPDNAQLHFIFPVLGNKDDCEYFRGKIRQERRSARYELNVEFVPNLNVREGLNLKVLSAPSRWERDTTYVTGRSARHTTNEMRFQATGLAWID